MKLATVFLVGGLACGSMAIGAEQSGPTADPAAQPASATEAPAQEAQPALTQKELEAAIIDDAKKQAEADQQSANEANGAEYRPWSPPPPATQKKPTHHAGSQFKPVSVTGSANQLYKVQWGVDSLRVQYTSSGNLLRFTYRVVDPKLAAPLADKKFTPAMYSPKHHAVLSVPVMEKIGPLRQAMGQEAGKDYWVAFSNQGLLVKPGDRVNVTIGNFHADGLLVE